MKLAIVLLAVMLAATPVLAATDEARGANFLTEFDITFWQTLPFAALWSSLAVSAVSPGGAVGWGGVMGFSVAASAANAFLHAKKTVAAHSQ